MSEGLNEQKGGEGEGDSIISDLCSITWLQTNCRDSSVNKQAPATGPLHRLNSHNNIYVFFWDIKLEDKDFTNMKQSFIHNWGQEGLDASTLNKENNTDGIMNSKLRKQHHWNKLLLIQAHWPWPICQWAYMENMLPVFTCTRGCLETELGCSDKS